VAEVVVVVLSGYSFTEKEAKRYAKKKSWSTVGGERTPGRLIFT